MWIFFGIKIAIFHKSIWADSTLSACLDRLVDLELTHSDVQEVLCVETFAEGQTSGDDEQVEIISEDSQKQKEKLGGWQM